MEQPTVSDRLWVWYLAAVVLITQYYVVSAYSAEANDSLYLLIGVTGAVAALVGLVVHRPPRWGAWMLIAASIGTYLVGDAVLAQLQADNVIVPFPSLADWLYLGVYPALIVAFAIIRRSVAPDRDRKATIDSLIVGVAALGVLAPLYLAELWNSPFFFESTERWVAVAYPIADAALLAAGARLVLAAGPRVNALTLLGAGSAVLVVGNAVYNVQALDFGYEDGGVASVGWLAFTCLLGAAVLHPPTELDGVTANRPWPSVARVAALASVVAAHVAWGDADSQVITAVCLGTLVVFGTVREIAPRVAERKTVEEPAPAAPEHMPVPV